MEVYVKNLNCKVDIESMFEEGIITGFTVNGEKFKLVKAYNNKLGVKMKHVRNRCNIFTNTSVDSLIYKKHKTEEQKVKDSYKRVLKYLTFAKLSEATNNTVANECIAKIPTSFTEWVEKGKQTLSDMYLTTGSEIDGNVITVDRINKLYPNIIKDVLDAIKTGRDVFYSNLPFNNKCMDVFVNVSNRSENGNNFTFVCGVKLYGKTGGKEYSYLLINEKTFIGYDVD